MRWPLIVIIVIYIKASAIAIANYMVFNFCVSCKFSYLKQSRILLAWLALELSVQNHVQFMVIRNYSVKTRATYKPSYTSV